MSAIPPIVRQFIVCDEMSVSGENAKQLSAIRLIHAITPVPGDTFPIRHPQLCAFLVLTGGVGSGRGRIVVRALETEAEIFRSPTHVIQHPVNRHEIAVVVFRIRDCVFHDPGVHWVEFWHDDSVLAQQHILVRPTS